GGRSGALRRPPVCGWIRPQWKAPGTCRGGGRPLHEADQDLARGFLLACSLFLFAALDIVADLDQCRSVGRGHPLRQLFAYTLRAWTPSSEFHRRPRRDAGLSAFTIARTVRES